MIKQICNWPKKSLLVKNLQFFTNTDFFGQLQICLLTLYIHICFWCNAMTHDYNNIFPAVSVQIRFHFCFASLFLVGIGSWMFHMTLQYEMQMLDELPMVWGGLTILYCMCVIRSHQEDKQLAFYMTTIASVFTMAHLYFKLPVLLFVSKFSSISTISV